MIRVDICCCLSTCRPQLNHAVAVEVAPGGLQVHPSNYQPKLPSPHTWPLGRGMMPGCRVSWLFRRLRKLLKRSVEAARGMAVRASSCDAGEGDVDCTNRGFSMLGG